MKVWLRHHLESLIATLRRIAGAPWTSIANIVVIGLAAALPLIGLLSIENGKALAGRMSVEPTVGVFFALDAGKTEIAAVESALRGTSGLRDVRFVSRELALERLRKIEGVGEAVSVLRSNPLPDAVMATIDPGFNESGAVLIDRLRSMPKVTHVQLDLAWLGRLQRILDVGGAALTVLAVLFGAVLIAVTFNTVRAQIHTQADEVAASRLVGATRAYLRRPFCYLGACLGLLGGGVAVGFAFAATTYLSEPAVRLADEYGSSFRLAFLDPTQTVMVLLATAALGLLGAYLAVSAYLLRDRDPA